ncbi:MAG: hypothetical protein AB7N76_11465 [Planctomycetota bacterium]
MSQFLRQAVVSRLRYLAEQVDRFETFHAGNARLALNDFTGTFTTDDVLSVLWEGLRVHLDLAVKEWHEEANREGRAPALPTSPAAAMAFRFATFRFVTREKVDLKNLVSNLFPGEHLNERLMHWKRLFVHPFAADCRAVVQALTARLPETEWVDPAPVLAEYLAGDFAREGFGPRAWTDADDAAAEAAAAAASARAAPGAPPVPADAVEEALRALEALLHGLDPDLALDLRALRLERTRPTFLRGRFLARLSALARHAPLRAACAAVEAALS